MENKENNLLKRAVSARQPKYVQDLLNEAFKESIENKRLAQSEIDLDIAQEFIRGVKSPKLKKLLNQTAIKEIQQNKRSVRYLPGRYGAKIKFNKKKALKIAGFTRPSQFERKIEIWKHEISISIEMLKVGFTMLAGALLPFWFKPLRYGVSTDLEATRSRARFVEMCKKNAKRLKIGEPVEASPFRMQKAGEIWDTGRESSGIKPAAFVPGPWAGNGLLCGDRESPLPEEVKVRE